MVLLAVAGSRSAVCVAYYAGHWAPGTKTYPSTLTVPSPHLPALQLGDVGLARMQRGTALSCAPKAVGTFDCEPGGAYASLLPLGSWGPC